MKQRGRKSIGDLSVPVQLDERVKPPDWLTTPQREEWNAIVDSLPADFFRPGDVALLAAFCIASALHRQSAVMIEAQGLFQKTEKGWPFPHPALQVLNTQAGAMATLAVKLRLCPSARMVQVDASKQAGDAPKGNRPWQAPEPDLRNLSS